MSERVTLMGAEEVRSAGHSMLDAAQQMQRAADQIGNDLREHSRRTEEIMRQNWQRTEDNLLTLRAVINQLLFKDGSPRV